MLDVKSDVSGTPAARCKKVRRSIVNLFPDSGCATLFSTLVRAGEDKFKSGPRPCQSDILAKSLDKVTLLVLDYEVWLLKTPKGRKKLEIFAPPPYRSGHDHNSFRCPFRKSCPNVLVMQPSQDRNGDNGVRSLNYSMQRRIFP